MENHVFVAMFGPLPDRPTGLAMSVIRRAQAFAKVGTRTTILVDQFVPDIHKHLVGLKQTDQLAGDSIRVRSMYLDLSGDHEGYETPYKSPIHANGDWTYTPDSKRPEVFRGRENGTYKEFVWMRSPDRVSFIDYLANGGYVRLRRTWFDHFGNPCKIEHMDQNNKPYLIEYLGRDGCVYLKESPGRQPRYEVTTPAGIQELSSQEELYSFWLRRLVLADESSPTIISEYGTHLETLESIQKATNAKIIYTFHSSHYSAPYHYGADVRSDQKPFLDKLRTLPSLIVLTEEQKLDLLKQYGPLSNISVIPHHVPADTRSVPRDTNKIVMVSRFDKLKGHKDALRAFARIHRSIPSLYFEIYGRGPDEKAIRDTINELELGDAARIVGFTDDAPSVFASAAISLVPSAYEGFCLSLIESMSQGCVPVTYGFKYGPRDIVTHGVDGLIAEPGNITDLADSSALLINDTHKREEMSQAARKVAFRFTEERLIEDWESALAALDSGSVSRSD